LFFVLRVILRKEWLAGIGFVLFFVLGRGIDSTNPVASVATYAIVYGIIVFVLLRYGVLALVVTIFVTDLVPQLLFTTNFSAWYGSGSPIIIGFMAGLSILAFRYELGGQRPMGPATGACPTGACEIRCYTASCAMNGQT